MFRTQMKELDNKLVDRLMEACPKFESVLAAVDNRFKVGIQTEILVDMLNYVDRMRYKKTPSEFVKEITFTNKGEKMFLCNSCCDSFNKGKVPPKSATNCLATVHVPEKFCLKSYLEQALIARVLLFINISRLKWPLAMPVVRGQCVVIPLGGQDILNNVKSMPRLPSESGFIDVLWKRKVGMKNTYLQNKVDPTRLFDALQFLKDSGNKHYLDTQSREEYEARGKAEDPIGFNLIFGQELPEEKDRQLVFVLDGSAEPILELKTYLEIHKHQTQEQEWKESDVVRKYQIDYDETLCMVDKYPEAFQVDGVIQHQKELQNKDPPRCVNPEEGGGEDEDIGEEDLDYFKQRLNNTDPRWRDNTHWVFSAAVFREKKDLQRNIDLGYKHGTPAEDSRGRTVYTLKDPFSVFQNVANTPAYHKKGKMEMYARLDNFGPFHIFFTVSCADRRWKENIIFVLRERGIDVRCLVDQRQKETYQVGR